MKNNLIVSDTNIFLDLYDSDTLKEFFFFTILRLLQQCLCLAKLKMMNFYIV